jgi:5-methylcytosine-specific restriction endonuclease McrA
MKRSRPHRIDPKLRAAVCAAAYGRCQACELPCADGHVHHRKQRSVGGRDELPNLVWLDGRCHDAVHAHIARSRALGLIVDRWNDPAEIPVRPWIAYALGDVS